MPDHIRAARNALFCLIADGLSPDFFDGDMIFLQGSPALNYENNIAVGRLSELYIIMFQVGCKTVSPLSR